MQSSLGKRLATPIVFIITFSWNCRPFPFPKLFLFPKVVTVTCNLHFLKLLVSVYGIEVHSQDQSTFQRLQVLGSCIAFGIKMVVLQS